MPLVRGSCVPFVLLLTGVLVKMELTSVSPNKETADLLGVTQSSTANSERISETLLSSTSPSVAPTSDSISHSVTPTSDSISPSITPTSGSISPSVTPTSDSISHSVTPTSDSISPTVTPTSDSISPSVIPTSDSISPSVIPTSDSISPSVTLTSDSISSSETSITEGATTALVPHTSPSDPGLESSSTEISSTHRGWASTETGNGTDQPEVTSTAVSNSSVIGGHVIHPDVRKEAQTTPTSNVSSSTEKAGTVLPPRQMEEGTFTTTTVATTKAKSKKLGIVGQCLIVIAVLAGLCTCFAVTIVVLCIKLNNQRQAYKMNSRVATELVCISRLLPEERKTPKRKKDRYNDDYYKEKMNIFTCDSEDDGLTLHSFVTEH